MTNTVHKSHFMRNTVMGAILAPVAVWGWQTYVPVTRPLPTDSDAKYPDVCAQILGPAGESMFHPKRNVPALIEADFEVIAEKLGKIDAIAARFGKMKRPTLAQVQEKCRTTQAVPQTTSAVTRFHRPDFG